MLFPIVVTSFERHWTVTGHHGPYVRKMSGSLGDFRSACTALAGKSPTNEMQDTVMEIAVVCTESMLFGSVRGSQLLGTLVIFNFSLFLLFVNNFIKSYCCNWDRKMWKQLQAISLYLLYFRKGWGYKFYSFLWHCLFFCIICKFISILL